MAEIVWVLLVTAAAFAFLQLALVVLVVGGLIFYPRETVTLMVPAALFALVRTHFWLSLPVLTVIAFGTVAGARGKGPPPTTPRLPAPPDP